MVIKKYILVLFSSFLLISCNKYHNSVDELFSKWDTKTTPGCAIVVLNDDKIIYKTNYGMANLEFNIPITSDTRFNVASISKQFTSYSALLLESRGKLKLDDDIRLYLPEVPDFGHIITISDLIYHTSGLREEFDMFSITGNIKEDDAGIYNLIEPVYIEDVLNFVKKQEKLNATPGKIFTYNNTGYSLLAEIVSRVSGQNFVKFTDNEIFNKLKMENSGFVVRPEMLSESDTTSYNYQYLKNNYKVNKNFHFVPGASQLYSTINDLLLWVSFLEDGINSGDDVITKMIKPKFRYYGAGISLGYYNNHPSYGHLGSTSSFNSQIMFVPETGFTFIMLSNNEEIKPYNYIKDIEDILINKKMPEKQIIYEKLNLDSKILEKYTNTYYVEEFGMLLDFSIMDNKLVLNNNTPLVPVKETVFFDPTFTSKFMFLEKKDSIPLLYVDYEGQTIKPRIIKKYESKDLEKFIGTFYSKELDISYTIKVDGINLITKTINGDIINLLYFNGNKLYGDVYYFSNLDFNKDYTEFLLSSAGGSSNIFSRRSRNISFVRLD